MFIRSGAAPRRRPVLAARAAFWVQASILVVVMAASSAPSPLYPLYQDLGGFPPVVLTVIFAAYVVALLAALLTVGSLSDHLGRRPVLLVALVLEIAAMLVFGLADSETTLGVAGLVQGVASGTATGALGAYVIELEPQGRRGLLRQLLAGFQSFLLALAGLADIVDQVQSMGVFRAERFAQNQ